MIFIVFSLLSSFGHCGLTHHAQYFTAIHTKDPDPLRPHFRAVVKGAGPNSELTARSPEVFLDGIADGPAIGQPSEPCTDPAVLALDKILSMEQVNRHAS